MSRTLYEVNPTRPVATCNPHRLLSNVFVFGPDIYFVDNQGPDGHAALWRRPRDSNVGEGSQLLVDMGTSTTSVDIIVFGVSVIMIRRSNNPFVVPEHHRPVPQGHRRAAERQHRHRR